MTEITAETLNAALVAFKAAPIPHGWKGDELREAQLRAALTAAAPHIAAQVAEQAAVTACGDLAATLRNTAELRRLARQLVDALSSDPFGSGVVATAALLRDHLDATDGGQP